MTGEEVRRRKPRGGRGQARIEEVARRAGVSPITVSRALRTPDKVSAEALERIRAAVDAVGYVPNRVAGSLASNRTSLVAALVPNIGNPLFAMTLRGLSDVLRRNDYHLMIASSAHSQTEEEELIRTILGQRPCGLVLHETLHSPATRSLVRSAGIPVIETGDLVDDPLDLVVSYSNFEATRAAALHLGGRGYRHVAFVASSASARSDRRRLGFEAGLAELGLAAEPALMLETVSDVPGGVEAIGRILEAGRPVDAVLFTGHAAAIGAVLECNRRSLAVPGRVAIATLDDTDLAQSLNPALTTVRIPRHALGEQAAGLMIERLRGERVGPSRIDVGFTVVHRATT